MSFKKFLSESKEIQIFHADNTGITKIDIDKFKLTPQNNLDGIGLYFGPLELSKHFGKYIVSTKVNPKNFLISTESLKKQIPIQKMVNFLKDLQRITNEEDFYYFVSDYTYIKDVDDINDNTLKKASTELINLTARNFQLTIAEVFGATILAKVWIEVFPKNLGLYNPSNGNYVVINPKIKIEPFNF